jgi:predicted NAD-dependent protein-ADP-ribosyltransferase YbiA (DUF1768 family)
MDIRSGAKYPAGKLSNFSPNSFVFRGVFVASMEGFLQSLKCKDFEVQKHVCTLVGLKAKKSGFNKNWYRDQTLYWAGKGILRGSVEYQELLDEAYNAMFEQNKKARKALMATNHANLTHSIGKTKKSETILTRQEFCSRLMNIRRSYFHKELLNGLKTSDN